MRRNELPEMFLGAEAAIGPLFLGAAGVTSAAAQRTPGDPLGPMRTPTQRASLGLRRLLPQVPLGPGDLLAIEGARYVRLSVETGDVWLTQSDDTCDYTLAAGESLVLRRSGVALVQSRAGAVVGIAVPRLSRTPRMRVVRKLEDVAAGHSVFKPFVDRTL